MGASPGAAGPLAAIRDLVVGRPPVGAGCPHQSRRLPSSIIIIIHFAGSAAIGAGNRARAVAFGALGGAGRITRKQDGFKLILFHHSATLAFRAADRAFSTTTSAVEHSGSFRLGRLEQ